MDVVETISIKDYEPAIVGYLVNFQKIGKREISSTLFDLIGRKVINLKLVKGKLNDDKGVYLLSLEKEENLKKYEKMLIEYLFEDKKEIHQEDLSAKLYKNNIDKNFLGEFLRQIQQTAKKRDFFSKKEGIRKERVYKVVNKVTTILASISSFLFAISLEGLDVINEDIIFVIVFLLVVALLFWSFKFIISYLFNITCYYNDFSEKGKEDYKRWKGFKKHLKKWSSLKDSPLMGVTIWQRYYAYSIALKVNKRFLRQMRKMGIEDSEIFTFVSSITSNIGYSARKIKKISFDKYGGSHVDYE